MIKVFSPIILFTYNRLYHVQKTVASLLKNIEAKYSDLYIFSDGPKNSKDTEIIQNVRKFLKTITGFNKIKIIERNENMGLANSIISGVSEILKLHDTVIVLEDDMLTSPYFLQFMNDALSIYQDEDAVVSIHGYIYPIKEKLPQTIINKLVYGANEEDIVASGLEDTMRMAFQEILKYKEKYKLDNYRMAAYASALKKIEKSYLELGI